MKRFLDKYKYHLGIILSFILLYFALKDIDLQELLFYFSYSNLDIVVYIFIVNIILRMIIAIRWNKLLENFPSNNYLTTYNYTNIGYFANNFLPARLGDVIKSYLLAKKKNYNKTQVFTSSIIERVFDLMGLSVLFIIAILRYDIPENILKGGAIFIGILIIATVTVLIMMYKKEFINNKLEQLSKNKLITFLRSKIESVLLYLQEYMNLKDLTYLVITTALIWFLYVFAGYIIVERLSGFLAWDASMLSLIFLGVSFILPSTPGNIGVHQFACVIAFGIIGLDKTQAIAFSFYYQIPVMLLSVILGLTSIYYEGFSIKGLSRLSKEVKSPGFDEVS